MRTLPCISTLSCKVLILIDKNTLKCFCLLCLESFDYHLAYYQAIIIQQMQAANL